MKKTTNMVIRAAFLACIAVSAVSSAKAAAYATGDAVIGFDTAVVTGAAQTDLSVDLGAITALHDSQTWDLSALLINDNALINTPFWGVVGWTGDNITGYVYESSPTSPDHSNAIGKWNNAGGTHGAIDNLGSLIGSSGSATPSSSDPYSFYSENFYSASSGALYNVYGQVGDEQTLDGSFNVLPLTQDFFKAGSTANSVAYLGQFTLSAAGILTYNTASVQNHSSRLPEPVLMWF